MRHAFSTRRTTLAAEVLVLKRPRFSPRKVLKLVAEAGRYPVLPMLVIMLLLVVPAIGANWVAPHPPTEGDLKQRLLPPSWVSEERLVKTVVEQVTGPDRDSVISLNEANTQRQIGRAQLVGTEPEREIVIGDRVEVVTKPGGRGTYLLGNGQAGSGYLEPYHLWVADFTCRCHHRHICLRHHWHDLGSCSGLLRWLGRRRYYEVCRYFPIYPRHIDGFGIGGSVGSQLHIDHRSVDYFLVGTVRAPIQR